MKIGILGAGPAGLYFALLMKKHNSAHQIRIIEQNPAGATYGWGVVFSDRALSYLQEHDAASYADIEAQMQIWADQTIVHKDEHVRIDGSGYSGISRLALLQILQQHCRQHGVEMQFETRLSDVSIFAECDLIVGADGANSVVRQQYAQYFQPSVSLLSNKYIWYGTHQWFETLSLIFRRYQGGSFVAHCYPYSPTASTFIVECDAETWRRTGFEQMSGTESRFYCEQVFKEDLGGHPLLLNKSVWLNFKVVTNRQWSYRNIVLLGDALRSVHFSIGSGTRMALEDAIALYKACVTAQNVPTALQAFEQAHRPGVEKLLSIAQRSYLWYEAFHEKMELDPLPFAYGYVTRSGRIDRERLRQRAPRFTASYEAYLAATERGKR